MKKLLITFYLILFFLNGRRGEIDPILKNYFEYLAKVKLVYPEVWEQKNKQVKNFDVKDLKYIFESEVLDNSFEKQNLFIKDFKKFGIVTNSYTVFHLFLGSQYFGLTSKRANNFLTVISEQGHYLADYTQLNNFPTYISNNVVYFDFDEEDGNKIEFNGKYPAKKIRIEGDFPFFINELNRKWEKVKELEKQGKYKPNKSKILNGEGEKEYRKKEYRRAETSFRKALKYNEVNVKALLNMSVVLIKQSRYDEAIKYGELAIKYSTGVENKEKGMAYYNIGLAYENMGKRKEALKSYQKSYELRKNKRVLEKIKQLGGK